MSDKAVTLLGRLCARSLHARKIPQTVALVATVMVKLKVWIDPYSWILFELRTAVEK